MFIVKFVASMNIIVVVCIGAQVVLCLKLSLGLTGMLFVIVYSQALGGYCILIGDFYAGMTLLLFTAESKAVIVFVARFKAGRNIICYCFG